MEDVSKLVADKGCCQQKIESGLDAAGRKKAENLEALWVEFSQLKESEKDALIQFAQSKPF